MALPFNGQGSDPERPMGTATRSEVATTSCCGMAVQAPMYEFMTSPPPMPMRPEARP